MLKIRITEELKEVLEQFDSKENLLQLFNQLVDLENRFVEERETQEFDIYEEDRLNIGHALDILYELFKGVEME